MKIKDSLIIILIVLVLFFVLGKEEGGIEKGVGQGGDIVKKGTIIQKIGYIADEIGWELKNFIQNGLNDLANSRNNLDKNREQIAYVNTKPIEFHYGSLLGEKEYFSDIKNDIYEKEINILSYNKIVNDKVSYFYPQNYVRLHEAVKMLLKSSEKKLGEKFKKQGKTNLLTTPDYYQLADSIGLLQGIINPINFERFLTSKEYKILMNNVRRYYPQLKDRNNEQWEKITRSQMAKFIVEDFMLSRENLKKSKNVNIEILLKNNMYPFSDIKTGAVSRAGFAQFLSQVSSVKKNHNIAKYYGKGKYYKDVNYSQNMYMYYIDHEHLLEYFTEQKRGEKFFYPNKIVTQYEGYYILEKFCNKKWIYNVEEDDKKDMTYESLVDLFVECVAAAPMKDQNKDFENKRSDIPVINWREKINILLN